MHLLIDDERTYIPADIIARNYKAGLAVLRTGVVTHLYLDHDLGDIVGTLEFTGLSVLQAALPEGIVPDNVQLVTANPVGQKNMANLLEDYGYKTIDGTNFMGKNNGT